ncbi:MAG: phage terminase large subunit family protein [Treponema sp.]|jgi:phage terminase large subunit GpA-like protein|nr:phage terminase large subunit family protein [Treponema sp.]
MPIPEKSYALGKRLQNIIKPPPKTTISEWAEKERVVSSAETSAPGDWHSDRAPYTVGIMDAISDPKVERVVVMCAAQMGKTNAGVLNPIGYYITYDPCPIMVVQPTIAMGETFSGKRLTPMIRDTPCLRGKIAPEKSRSPDNKILEKSFPGGYIVIAGANSAPSLKSRPVRVVLFDEVDEAPDNLAGQGDPVELAFARTNAFPNRKKVLTSTPTIKGKSRIEAAYNDSTRGRWSHQCPECKEWSPFSWRRLDFETMGMSCPFCGGAYSRREWEAGGGVWVAENPEHDTKGFHVNALDSQLAWDNLVEKWEDAQRLAKKGDYSKLITFINTILAETWEITGEVVESHALETRREVYSSEAPDGVCVLTMGVDVQDNRLACGIWGWGLGFENWLISYQEFWGDPRQGEVWSRIDDLLARTWSYGNGKQLRISRAAVDTGGHMTPQVYAYCKARQSRGVYPIKGQGGDKLPLTRPSKTSREKGLFIVGVDGIKADLVTWLKIGRPGDGCCHFPKDNDGRPINGCDANFFSMLTAEKRVIIQNKSGYPRYEWHKASGDRNEAFDTFCYARAALRIMSPKDDVMLRRIYTAEPWAGPTGEKKPAVAPEPGERKKPTVGKNEIARGKGIEL